MAWRSEVRERAREWARPQRDPSASSVVPTIIKQTVACLFVFALVLGASHAERGLAVDVAAFAKAATEKDMLFQEVKAWAQEIPDGLKRLVSFDIKGFWSRTVMGERTEFAWPASGTITSYFGWRPNPESTGMSLHQGIDIDAPLGTKVVSVLDGVVADVRTSPEFGLVVEVTHGGGFSSVYGHLDSAAVSKDQQVKKGDSIGTVGDSGNAVVPRLYFEIRRDGLEVDPMTILPPLVEGS